MSIAKDLQKILKEQEQQDILDKQIQELLQQVKTSDLSTASKEELKKMRHELLKTQKLINPYGRTIDGKERLMCGSLTVIRDEYAKKFFMTSIIGYLFRALNEWNVPENVPAVDINDYIKNPDVLKPPEMANGQAPDPAMLQAYEESRAWMEKRIIVLQFLQDTLLFNPDEHVRSAHIPNPDEPERKPIATAAAQLAVYHRRSELQAKKKQDLKALYKADTMVEYVDRVLFAVPEQEYQDKLRDLKKKMLKDLKDRRDELKDLTTRTKITVHKKIVSTNGEEKDIVVMRDVTEDDIAAANTRIKALNIIIGRLISNLAEVDDRMQRYTDYIAWKERKAQEEIEMKKAAELEMAEREKHTRFADSLEMKEKIAYVERMNAKFDAQRKKEQEHAESVILVGKEEIPVADSKAVIEAVDKVLASNVETATAELDMSAVAETKDSPVVTEVAAKKPKKKFDKNIVRPKAHVMPPSTDEIEADAMRLVTGEKTDKDPHVTKRVTEIIPPHDIYSKLNRYIEQNHDALRNAVTDLYCEKPDIETMFNPYDIFDDDPPSVKNARTKDQKATDFVERNKNTTIAPIITFTTNRWNLMGSFAENKERVQYFNSQTNVLEEMANQIQRDQMLGRDLMQKRKEKKRRENRELGKDEVDEGDKKFEEWKKLNAPAAGYVEEDVDDPMRPPDAIDVPVFTVKDGGRIIEKTKFYTEAEAPEGLNDLAEAQSAIQFRK